MRQRWWQGGLLAVALLAADARPAQGQTNAPCGIADAIGYPMASVITDTISNGYDDFGIYRQRFGGRHLGLDVGFYQTGEPVLAVARGRVSYSDPLGWDTEGGVVVVEHTFPDGEMIYTLYGHVEETDEVRLPRVGTCVALGDVVGVVGDPMHSAPHLHYEVRTRLPNDGGPGYIESNPLLVGWLHPLDFTQVWQARFTDAYLRHMTLSAPPTVPSVQLEGGVTVFARGDVVEAVWPPSSTLWQMRADTNITALAALPGERVVVQSASGQVAVLRQGRYLALWQTSPTDTPLVVLGDVLILPQLGHLDAWTTDGRAAWSLPLAPGAVEGFVAGSDSVALALRHADSMTWLEVGVDGLVRQEVALAARPVFAPRVGAPGWWLLTDRVLAHAQGSVLTPVVSVPGAVGRNAVLAVDRADHVYLYADDASRTLWSYDAAGALRWRAEVPSGGGGLPPLLRAGGCTLLLLDAYGALSVLALGDGARVTQVGLYAGGLRHRSPRARQLWVLPDETVMISAGFLTTMWLDGWLLGGDAMTPCAQGATYVGM